MNRSIKKRDQKHFIFGLTLLALAATCFLFVNTIRSLLEYHTYGQAAPSYALISSHTGSCVLSICYLIVFLCFFFFISMPQIILVTAYVFIWWKWLKLVLSKFEELPVTRNFQLFICSWYQYTSCQEKLVLSKFYSRMASKKPRTDFAVQSRYPSLAASLSPYRTLTGGDGHSMQWTHHDFVEFPPSLWFRWEP